MSEETRFRKAVLFANVAENPQLHEKLDQSEVARAIDRCLKRMERAAEIFNGRMIRLVGDALMAVFDSVDDAYQAAIEMQQRVADLPPVSGSKLEICIAFSWGLVTISHGTAAGKSVDLAAALAKLAAPGQMLTTLPAQSALAPELKKATRPLDLNFAFGGETPSKLKIFEMLVPELPFRAVYSRPLPKPVPSPTHRLCLRYQGELIFLDSLNPSIKIGRSTRSDLIIHNQHASRKHASIELRDDKIVLLDQSSNGTFVTPNGAPEFLVRHEKYELQRAGILSFAAPLSAKDADYAEFEVL